MAHPEGAALGPAAGAHTSYGRCGAVSEPVSALVRLAPPAR